MIQEYGTSAPALKKRTGEEDENDGAMTVTTANGPAASVPKPAPSTTGPQVQAPTSFTPPQTPISGSPLITAAQGAVSGAPSSVPASPTPLPVSPTLPAAPGAAGPTPIPFAPPGVGNPSINWQKDPITGGWVKPEDLNVRQPDGSYRTAAGVQTDPAGTDHRLFFDGSLDAGGRPIGLTGDTMQRPGGPITAGPVKGTPAAGTWGSQFNPASEPAPAAGAPPAALAEVAARPTPIPFSPPGVQPSVSPSLASAAGPSMTSAQGIGAQQSGGATAGAPAVSGAPGGVPGLATSAITGEETPYAVNPAQSAGLSALLERAQKAVMQGLDQPTAWDDELAADVKTSARRGIDDNYTDEDQALRAELANRGLSYSDVASKRYLDLGARKANALTDLDTSIARERANSIAQGRSAALSAAMNAIGMNAGLESSYRDEQRGERGYVDTLRDKAKNDAITETLMSSQLGQQNFDNIFRLIQSGMGYGANGANLLGSAGAGYGYAGGQYGQQADAGNAGLGDLSQLAMMLFGGGR